MDVACLEHHGCIRQPALVVGVGRNGGSQSWWLSILWRWQVVVVVMGGVCVPMAVVMVKVVKGG